jgi:hypothetical protein
MELFVRTLSCLLELNWKLKCFARIACLTKELSVNDVSGAIPEVKAVGRFLNAPECAFKLEKIAEDGFCCFRILENAARKSLGWKKSSSQFCKEVAKFAIKSAEAAGKEIGGEALENDEVLKELKRLAKDANPVENLKDGLWKRLEVQHILKGFVELFPGRVAVNVYQTGNGKGDGDGNGKVRKTDTYGDARGGSEGGGGGGDSDRRGDGGGAGVQVNVLQWNMTHRYDCLVRMGGGMK